MAVHGVSRSTRDLDLFTVSVDALADDTWLALRSTGVEVQVARGDAQDPLAGVVRLSAPREHPIDVIVGKSPWQGGLLRRARAAAIEGVDVPVATPADLILLKLYAGGPQDAWDIEQLLAGPERAAFVAEVEATLDTLPAECRGLWRRIRGGGPPST
ncbi:MAG: hypothetical protein ACREJV_04185 [Candidatus Rokuibacteriota bacterium]